VGFVPRDGFETVAAARTEEPYVGVEAVDPRGRSLGRSEPVRPGERSAPRPS
jgi:hypothetical protein